MNIITKCIRKFINNPLIYFSLCLERMPGSWFLKSLMPDKWYLKHIFRLCHGYELNLKHPKTFSEKLQWLKLYDRRPEYVTMVDKYEAKFYVSSLIGEKYIIPTLGVWDKVEDIDWESLPNQFVMKCTHDSGGIIICKDISKLNIEYSMQKLRRSLNHNYYLNGREWPYKNVKKRIIAEKFLDPEKTLATSDLPDYKFFCFNGEPKYCQVIRDRNSKETIDFYDMDWNHQEFVGLNPVARNGLTPVARNGLTPVARPKHLEEMKDICRKLAKDIPFVRVDLYVLANKEYFGELTFYPASGMGVFTPEEWNGKLGDLLTVPKVIGGG